MKIRKHHCHYCCCCCCCSKQMPPNRAPWPCQSPCRDRAPAPWRRARTARRRTRRAARIRSDAARARRDRSAFDAPPRRPRRLAVVRASRCVLATGRCTTPTTGYDCRPRTPPTIIEFSFNLPPIPTTNTTTTTTTTTTTKLRTISPSLP
jgi:hypothetical protein